MSFNRLGYDTCAYEQNLNQSKGPGEYVLNVPRYSCEPCFPENPRNKLQGGGASTVGKGNFLNVDIESDLKGQTRLASKCAAQNFMPSCEAPKLTHYRDCLLTSEETRTTNPPCNLRGTGWNRWEWLCINPQDKVSFNNYPNGLTPFDSYIDSVRMAKDNHRPCLPTPLNQEESLPNGKYVEEADLCDTIIGDKINDVWEVPTDVPNRNIFKEQQGTNQLSDVFDNTYFKKDDFCALDGNCEGSRVWEVPTAEPSVQWKQMS